MAFPDAAPIMLLSEASLKSVNSHLQDQDAVPMKKHCFFLKASLPITSPTFTVKMSMKMKFSNDEIYYNFSQKKPKITNM